MRTKCKLNKVKPNKNPSEGRRMQELGCADEVKEIGCADER